MAPRPASGAGSGRLALHKTCSGSNGLGTSKVHAELPPLLQPPQVHNKSFRTICGRRRRHHTTPTSNLRLPVRSNAAQCAVVELILETESLGIVGSGLPRRFEIRLYDHEISLFIPAPNRSSVPPDGQPNADGHLRDRRRRFARNLIAGVAQQAPPSSVSGSGLASSNTFSNHSFSFPDSSSRYPCRTKTSLHRGSTFGTLVHMSLFLPHRRGFPGNSLKFSSFVRLNRMQVLY